MAEIDLARCDFMSMDETSIEPQVIAAANAHTEHRGLTVHRDTAGPDPLFCLTTGRDTKTCKHFLKTLAFGIRFLHVRARRARTGGMACMLPALRAVLRASG